MHTLQGRLLENNLRLVLRKEAIAEIMELFRPICLTRPAMKESKAYEDLSGYATGADPVQKGKRVKEVAKETFQICQATEFNSALRKGKQTKAALYDLPGIEDMVPNIWSPVKVAYDKYEALLWLVSHDWREQLKSFYAYARGMQSRGDVYSTKRILAVTHVSVMRKHGYGYLEEIIVRRVDNDLYRFKEEIGSQSIRAMMLASDILRNSTKKLTASKSWLSKASQDLQLGDASY
ncbi:hypothetical protein Tco_0633323 [Tanacetum coccineum]